MYNQIAKIIRIALNNELQQEEIEKILEKPKHADMGDVSFPCFTLAKKLRKAPQNIAEELASNIKDSLVEKIEVVGAYVNIFLNQQVVATQVLEEIINKQESYGDYAKKNQSIVIDLSSPNIAKPFHMGHLRSTVIGNALANIAEKNGYDVVRINHLGDWGTQFGKLIVAYKRWGNKEKIEKSPIPELLKLYVHFHETVEENEALIDEARAAFKSLEDGDEEALSLWKWFRDVSLLEFQQIYDLLGITFDSLNGEAFYNDKMETAVDELQQKGLLVESDGAMVVELENMPPCLVTKTDGSTLYATRDLAAALYRQQEYAFSKAFYVVGNEQSLHFKQLFLVLEKMGYKWAKEMKHVPFGLILKDGKKLSTRKGKIIFLKDVLEEAIQAAKENIEEKNPNLLNKDEVAKAVGVGAVIFHDLKNDRMNDVEFSLEQMLSFEGETGPYLQYTYARICSLLERGGLPVTNSSVYGLGQEAWETLKALQEFQQILGKAFDNADPSQIAKYALGLARHFNKFYANTKVLVENDTKKARLALCSAVATVLKECLRLLGMEAPEKM